MDAHVPAATSSFNPPAAEEDIAGAQDELGTELPDDLVEWWRRADGCGEAVSLLPMLYRPMTIREALDDRRRWLASQGDTYGLRLSELSAAPAGSTGELFALLPEFLPIAADDCGWYLLIDLRQGDQHGCVRELDKYEGLQPPRWAGVEEMLTEVADALENGTPAARYVAAIEEDELCWSPVVSGYKC
jgi:cell wall assembly regulator SMI1